MGAQEKTQALMPEHQSLRQRLSVMGYWHGWLGSLKQTSSHEFRIQTKRAPQPPQLVLLPQAFVIVPHESTKQRGAGQTQTLLAQLSPLPHKPQLLMLRVAPQLSVALNEPQVLPNLEHIAAFVSGVQTQLFPEQLSLLLHEPQLDTVRAAPQLSVPERDPQTAPWRVQKLASLSGVQAHWLFALQLVGAVHAPQLLTVRCMPQLSRLVTVPQVLPKREQKAALDSGWQAQVLFAPQLVGATQVPQLATVRAAPQLS